MTTVQKMLAAAMKSLTTTSLGDSILVPEQRDRFVQAMETRAPFLREARRINMASHTTNLDRWLLDEILEAPAAEGETFTGEQTPSTFTNKLVAVKPRGRVKASDEALADSLARGDAANQLVQLIGARAGIDLEKLFVQGDTASGDTYLALTDGWVKLAGNTIDGGTADFDATDVEDMFEAQLLTLDPRWLTDRSRMRFWVPFDIENDYRNVLRQRGTDLADGAQVGDRGLAFKGIRVVEAPSMPAGTSLLGDIDNLCYGVRQDIEVEDERVASADRVDFHVRVRGDANYIDEDGAVAATGYTG